MKTLMIVGVAAASLLAAKAFAADPVEGVWLTQAGDAHVKVAPCAGAGDRLCGTIVWLKAPRDEAGQAKHDVHNPDPALRPRPLMGLAIIRDFQSAGGGQWKGGRIYDPKSGKTYASKMRIAPDGTLKVAGCVSIICQSQTWRRVS